jgi:threonine/homoserine/homoserine lactone efflux protein
LAFVLAVLALLAVPGPTNTLLATSGAAAGFNRSLHLLVAENVGYLISIAVLTLAVGPVVNASHAARIELQVACALFLFYAAWKLWREGASTITSEKPVSFRRVLIATLLNPKAAVFAFVIVPHLSRGEFVRAAPYMLSLMALIGMLGALWIGGGTAMRAGARSTLHGGWARRAGALALGLFAVLISVSAFNA